ncbi:MAG: hypothetical protein A3G76_11930 [Acidobacteria bacterium RIFCSPLOWO2_12_FULL_65_11]|nr:MAG: hypothetical protein A3H95_00490 [Acidobacteria bacterium RIFCSPLOWO2_02_FULL_64_15]OFW33503.1 MAG: hypothetical protein A3G76_11930 [Acidobacteria bacterium RIFCSPLOWO2_12_FULL_65_11]
MKMAPTTPTPCAQRSGWPTYMPSGPLPAECAQMNMRFGLPRYLVTFAFSQSTMTDRSRPVSSQLPPPGWRCTVTPTMPFLMAHRPMLS